ncbi:MAG TPA: hypothetical protein VLK84_15245 [Longimicrobium sp.]|nr:hypothetical protein [Longimicrobium sp.]
MKLNPEELEVVSFATDPNAQLAQAYLGADTAAPVAAPYNPIDPTPNSRCFVCD